MPFSGPQPVDLHEISALNRAFVQLLVQADEAASLLAGFPEDLAARISAMTCEERDSIAAVPFLVFSLRERDDDYWERLLAEDGNLDLYTDADAVSPGRASLVSAALGFLWQMSRTNPYTLRVICGATLHWCERLAGLPLTAVIQRASSRGDILELRARENHRLWDRLTSVPDNDTDVRSAVQLSALQSLLIQAEPSSPPRWRSAACRQSAPALRLADDGPGS